MDQGTLSAERLYSLFQNMGFEYGVRHQGVKEVYLGHKQVLGRLVLPQSLLDEREAYVIHPSLADAALQACLGLSIESVKTALPFAIEEMEIFAKSMQLSNFKNCTTHPLMFEMFGWQIRS